jgi:LmbE family N-acetylglucosaminyl deacetylase
LAQLHVSDLSGSLAEKRQCPTCRDCGVRRGDLYGHALYRAHSTLESVTQHAEYALWWFGIECEHNSRTSVRFDKRADCSTGDGDATVDDGHGCVECLHLGQIMRGVADRRSVVGGEALHCFQQPCSCTNVNTGCRLIEQQQLRAMQHCAGSMYPALLATRQRTYLSIEQLREFKSVCRFRDPRRKVPGGHVVKGAEAFEVVTHRERWIDAEILRRQPDCLRTLLTRSAGFSGRSCTVHHHGARIRGSQSCDDRNEGCLAGPVRSEQAADLPRFYRKIKTAERFDLLVLLAQRRDCEHARTLEDGKLRCMGILVCFHAHPDDESIATGGTIARAAAHGHRVVLVVATGGEFGESPANLGADETLAMRRATETRISAELLGVSRVEFLGYRDSGMTGWEQNTHPDAFMNAPLDEAAERLAAILREENADVLTTYDWHGNYGHPDHIAVHRVGNRAGQLAGTPNIYEATMNRDNMAEQIAQMKAANPEADLPDMNGTDDGVPFGLPEAELTTAIDVRDFVAKKRASMAAHASQITDGSFFLQMPDDVFALAFGTEWFARVGAPGGICEQWLTGLD